MRILHLISGGDTGGAKTHVLTLLTNLKKLNIDVELLCIMEGVFTKEAKELGIPVTIIPQVRRYDMSATKKVMEYINKSGCDLVHCHGARANYIAMFIMNKVNVPMITTLHSDYKLDFKGDIRKRIIYTPINAIALRRFDHILTVTNAFKDMLIKRGFKKEKLEVIYNGCDFNKELSIVPKAEFMSRLGIKYDNNKKYIGIAARLQAVKGVEIFLEAAKILCGRTENAEFIILGDGDLMLQYKKFVRDNRLEDRIYFGGHISEEFLMNSFYNAIDINTLTSYSESFPYALLEGARQKKATVATAVGGIVEMIEDGRTGYLVPSGDYNALAGKLERLINDEWVRNSLGNAFYEDAKARFSVESMALTHKKIYEKIVKEIKQ